MLFFGLLQVRIAPVSQIGLGEAQGRAARWLALVGDGLRPAVPAGPGLSADLADWEGGSSGLWQCLRLSGDVSVLSFG